jgi:hypothetical protein
MTSTSAGRRHGEEGVPFPEHARRERAARGWSPRNVGRIDVTTRRGHDAAAGTDGAA